MAKILVVDDSPLIHNLMRQALEKNGHEVCGDAKDGKEALELYAKLQPDLVFMDITMPIMDGLEATKAIKSRFPQARVIMLSAMGDEELVAEAMNIGVDVFLKKPFNEYKVVSAISQLM
ncbi:MAG: response regulator [Acidobacteriota bacterium]